MDLDKSRLLFGTDAPPVDDPDDDELMAFFAGDPLLRVLNDSGRVPTHLRPPVLSALAVQILTDDPPSTWAAASRLVAAGFDRPEVLDQLGVVALHEMHDLLSAAHVADPATNSLPAPPAPSAPSAPSASSAFLGLDVARFDRRLASLPLPSSDELADAVRSAVSGHPGSTVDEVVALTLDALGRQPNDEIADSMAQQMVDHLWEDLGELSLLSGDRVVFVPSLVADVVLTHRLTEDDMARAGVMGVSGWAYVPDWFVHHHQTDLLWPEEWISAHTVDDLVAITVDIDGAVTIAAATPVTPSEALLAALRSQCEQQVAIDDMPSSIDELLLGVLLEMPEAFATPQLPLTELCTQAGLIVRGSEVAPSEDPWIQQRRYELTEFFTARATSEQQATAAHSIVDAIGPGAPELDGPRARALLRSFGDEELFRLVIDAVRDLSGAAELGAYGARFEELRGFAHSPAERSVAEFALALITERLGDGVAAEARVIAALAMDPTSAQIIDRRAYYASVRGDAALAARLWGELEGNDVAEVQIVRTFASAGAPKLGRNDPCWCGSGRKFKSCHLGVVRQSALTERVGWLWHKAAGYLNRYGGPADMDVFTLAQSRADDPDDPESIMTMLGDPVVVDIALTELGWFPDFIETLGPLLPEDEAMLAGTWMLVPRSVHVVDAAPSGGFVSMRDVRTGAVAQVRARVSTAEAPVGSQWCGRLVPDGEAQRFIGAVFPLVSGEVDEVLALCDSDAPDELCAYAGSVLRLVGSRGAGFTAL